MTQPIKPRTDAALCRNGRAEEGHSHKHRIENAHPGPLSSDRSTFTCAKV